MGFYDMTILPGNLSFVDGIPNFFGAYYDRLTDREVLPFLNDCVDGAIFPTFSPSYTKTSTGTTIGPFTTTTHIASLTAKLEPVIMGGNTFYGDVTLGPKDRFVHVAFSGTLNLLAADANNFVAWTIRVGIPDVDVTRWLTRDDDTFKLVGQTNLTGMLPIAGYETFEVTPSTIYRFQLFAGYYGSTLPTQSLQPYGTSNQPFSFNVWIGG